VRITAVDEPAHRAPLAIVRDGLRRVGRAPLVLLGVWAVTALAVLPGAAALYATIAADLGSSMAAASAAAGVNTWWWQEFLARQPAFGATFQPVIIGFAAVLANTSAFLAAAPPRASFAVTGAMYVLLWMFLLGGILDRYARQRRVGTHGFFAASAVFFFRFLRLAVIAAVVWTFVFGVLHGWLFRGLYGWLTRETTVERTAFAWYAVLTLAFVLIVAAFMVIFDYAKVRAVVEDRRSMIGALVAGTRFVRRNTAAVAGVFLLNALLFGLVLAAYGLVAPGAAGGSVLAVAAGFLVGQAYIAARLFVKLSFYASAVALFQDRLAHAEYTAAPPAVWPDSPAVETIREDTEMKNEK
jgi:hypothetical protein